MSINRNLPCRRASAAVLALALAAPWPAAAQDAGTASQTQRVVDLAGLAQSPATNADRGTGSRKLYDKPSAGGVGLSISEKPAPSPQLHLSTSIETKVENRTTNHVGGCCGGTTASDVPTPSAPAAAPHVKGAGFEFGHFVQQSVGRPLPVFGAELARRVEAALDAVLPADYRVGPGDQILVRAWGQIDLDLELTIDRNGQVFVPRIGTVTVAGLTAAELAPHLKRVIARQYRDFELSATLGALRAVHYYTSGFARQPGLHSVSSASTVLHAMMAAGGPGDRANPRNVILRRSGQPTLTFDLYDMLVDGRRGDDPQIRAGDIIHFEPSLGMAAMAGQIHREAIFHVRLGDTVGDLLRFAGGFSATADRSQLRVERIDARGRRTMERFELDDEALRRPVRSGDLYIVLPVSPRIEQVVTLRGNVAAPLRAPWREGLRVSELIGESRALVRPAVLAQRNERASLDRLGDPGRDVDISRDYPEVNWDYASIERIDPRTHDVSVIDFDLGRAVLARDPAHDLVLQAGDQVTVYARADFEQPGTRRIRLMRVEGEVHRPGIYSVPVGGRLSDVLRMAGGLTPNAYVYGSRLLRASARKQEETRIREAIARVEQDYYRRVATRSQGVVAQEDAMMAGAELEAVRTLIARLRQYKGEGRVILDLPGRQALGTDFPEMLVEDEDVLVIPSRPSTVTVAGAVVQVGSLLWRDGAGLDHYLARSGGTRRFADRAGIVVMHADGSVQLAQRGLWSSTSVEPGDTIFVPEDVETVTTMRAIKDWTTILYQFGLGAAALKVIGGL